MSALIRQQPPADRGRINIDDPVELRWWCTRLGCTDRRLTEAVRAVGAAATRVAHYLRERRNALMKD